MTHDRQWLRQFVSLGERAIVEGIPQCDVERQEDTIVRAWQMLETQPGVVLADEVGMGKTFEALGVAAAFHNQKPSSRIVVLTPGPDLNTKWVKEFNKFPYKFGAKSDAVNPATTLREFISSVKTCPVTVAPITMFQSGRGADEQAYLLSLYCHWKGKELHWNSANALFARALGPTARRAPVDDRLFLDTFAFGEIESKLGKAFQKLDVVYVDEGLSGFENKRRVRHLLTIARARIAGHMMPIIDLLIVDEAHKLKNPGSLRSEALRTVFRKRFRKALFLTATPFQLDVTELKEVFSVFSQARQAPSDLMSEVDALLANIREYKSLYEDFQHTWSSLEPEFAARFSQAYDCSRDEVQRLEDPSSKILLSQIDRLLELKIEEIEPGFQKWMIRSLRDGKREYRKDHPQPLAVRGPNRLPFLIYERFIAELFRRQHRTHKVAAEINMVSSYAAAKKGTIFKDLKDIPEQAHEYRKLLRRLLRQFENSGDSDHPKLKHVVTDAIKAAESGEKTLIFCSRKETLKQLSKELNAAWDSRILGKWQCVYPNASQDDIFGNRGEEDHQKGRHTLLHERFHRPQYSLYLALRESYLFTVEPMADWANANLTQIVSEANNLLGLLWVGTSTATRIDYQLTKRCVEQATARLWRKAHPDREPASKGVHRLCSPEFLTLGLDLHSDEDEADTRGDSQPEWKISEHSALMAIGNLGSLWEGLKTELDQLSYELRVRVVEQLARYLTARHVPFVADLLQEAKAQGIDVESIRSEELLNCMPIFWQSATGKHWQSHLREFLRYFNAGTDVEKDDLLSGPFSELRISFARHTAEGETREKLRLAFNTPLFPMVLVGNSVMQEGLDLHKCCRRIVHHDLEWNPATIEQRIGRIDRLGSLTSCMRETDPSVKLDILYPIINGTIDQQLYRTVKNREKWLEFLLGAAPNFSEYSIDDREPSPLPNRLARELAIDLSPNKIPVGSELRQA